MFVDFTSKNNTSRKNKNKQRENITHAIYKMKCVTRRQNITYFFNLGAGHDFLKLLNNVLFHAKAKS